MKIITIIFRILALPFFAGITLIAVLRIWIIWMWYFIRFGGESIAYSEKIRPRTILDVYNKLLKVEEDIQNDKVYNK